MKSPLIAALSAGVALSVMAAGATFAQPTQAPAAPRAEHVKREHNPAEHAQRLRATLQLTSAQEPALQAFIAASAQHRGDRMERRPQRQEMQKLTTPQRLDRMAATMAERQQRCAQHAAAVRQFYAQLTPAQQKAFDAMHQGRGHKRMMKRHGGHGGQGH